MEIIIVNHQRNRFKGLGNIDSIKKKLWVNYNNKDKISIHSTILDHIIPYSISLDSSLINLQLLTPIENREKTQKDFKIFRLFRKKGWTEKVTGYSIELKKPIDFLKKEYLKEFEKHD